MYETPEIRPPRRAHSRLRLGIPAALSTEDGEQRITLLNLSQGGARVRLIDDEPVDGGGVLKWMDKFVFGLRVWQAGPEMGLRFDNPIDWDWVVATRHWEPSRLPQASTQAKSGANTPRNSQVGKGRDSEASARLIRKALAICLLSIVIGLGAAWWGDLF